LPDSPRFSGLPIRQAGGRASRAPQERGTPGFVAVGRVGAPWGIHGDLKVQPLTDFPERFRPGAVLWLRGHRYEVLRSRRSRGLFYLGLSGVESRDAAQKLGGSLLEVPDTELTPLPEGQYYQFQVIGLEVCTPDGERLGRVADILSTPSNDVYIVRGGPKELLIPAIEDVVIEVDLEGGRLVVEPPEEL
jgi:16S rRNA processing protein RimM